jgi:hypothetical protein
VLFRYGWAQLWSKPLEYNAGQLPGIGIEVARWLAERKVTATGGDTSTNEVSPSKGQGVVIPVHQELMMKNGIFNIENLTFEELAAEPHLRVLAHRDADSLQRRHGLAASAARDPLARRTRLSVAARGPSVKKAFNGGAMLRGMSSPHAPPSIFCPVGCAARRQRRTRESPDDRIRRA